MSRVFGCVIAFWFVMVISSYGYCHGPQDSVSQYGYAFLWGIDPVVSHALGGSYVHGPGWDLNPPGWYSMNREDNEKLKEFRNSFQKDTLGLRKQLVSKQMELTTIWAQPNFEAVKAEKLANEIAQLHAELEKERSKHLIRCRQQFGGQHWTCPGIWLDVKIPE